MYNVIIEEEEIKIVDSFDEPIIFDKIGSEYIVKIKNLENVYCFTKFNFNSYDSNDLKYLKIYYRTSKDNTEWFEWQELKQNIENYPPTNPDDPLFIQLKFVREGTLEDGKVSLFDYELIGILNRNEIILSDENYIILSPNEERILKSPFRFKVFKIDDIEILPESDEFDIYYRFSQDSSRSWTQWEPLSKENISTVRINPIRFFEIEYKIKNGRKPLIINDINLIGDFQNVSKDYQKSNLMGIRENCKSTEWGFYDSDGNYYPNSNMNMDGSSEVNSEDGVLPEMSNEENANLYNPYDQAIATNLLNKLSVDAEQMFGHKVIYFSTDADGKGIDYTLHEYQLHNINCKGDLKVSIEGNEFPDNQIKMNIFDLDLFDSMEAHVTKKQFKNIFGEERRPRKRDFMYFCQVSRMYEVDHAQQFRNFNNTAVSYKMILKKWTQKANVKAGNSVIENELAKLDKNSTLDELFGFENKQDKKSIANKSHIEPLSRDTRRYTYKAKIVKYLLENSSNIISKSFYELSTVSYNDIAIKYNNFNKELKVSDNISLMMWFNINNYMIDEEFKFMSVYDEDNKKGWKVSLKNNSIITYLNDTEYVYDLLPYENGDDPDCLNEDVWYALVMNIDQRQRKLEHYIYKRNVSRERNASLLKDTKLGRVYKNSMNIEPIEYIIEDENISPTIYASDMKITNIRLFNDVVPENQNSKLLNQYIIGTDSKHLIFADNATEKLELPRFPYNEDDMDKFNGQDKN